MAISAVTIQNFRSINTFTSTLKDLNIFIGHNDAGKSNVLRALDLFFNHSKKSGVDLVWERDFCRFATVRTRRAPEITIELEITPPASFANREPVLWRRAWRRDGLHVERIVHRGGSEVSSKSKVGAFLRSMRYDYVPAIKGPEYFQSLLSSVHDMLEATVEEDVRQASLAFTKSINTNTQRLLENIKARLDLETTIELPPDLRDLFAQLEFTSFSGEQTFSLSQRGDGLKVRHVPIVLRWLAEQANHLSAPGKPKAVTVWGYEEPENNLELRRCFDLAREFVDGCAGIQALVTTHSPAFYSICRDGSPERIQLFTVEKHSGPPTTSITPLEATAVNDLDSSMGCMLLVEPHIRDLRSKLDQLRRFKATMQDRSITTLFCEGPTDKALLQRAIQLFHPQHENAIVIPDPPQTGGGHLWVADMMKSWAYARPTAKCVGLFDCDREAKETKVRVNKELQDTPFATGVLLKPCDLVKECRRANFPVPFAIEELLSPSVWEHAYQQGWLEERPELIKLYNFTDVNKTFNDYLRSSIDDPAALRLIQYRVRGSHKRDMCQYVLSLQPSDVRAALEGLRPTLLECSKKLGHAETLVTPERDARSAALTD